MSACLPTSSEPIRSRHADRLGAGDRGHLERLMGAESLRVEPAVAGDSGGKGCGAQDVGDVTGVGGVAPERDATAALDDLGVATHSR